jgi:hypothetical protein
MSLEFWLTTLVIVAAPGTGVVTTLAAGLSRGAGASLVAAFGGALGILPHIGAALIGLAAVLHASAFRQLPAVLALRAANHPFQKKTHLSLRFRPPEQRADALLQSPKPFNALSSSCLNAERPD